jgi:hypothetical protein
VRRRGSLVPVPLEPAPVQVEGEGESGPQGLAEAFAVALSPEQQELAL